MHHSNVFIMSLTHKSHPNIWIHFSCQWPIICFKRKIDEVKTQECSLEKYINVLKVLSMNGNKTTDLWKQNGCSISSVKVKSKLSGKKKLDSKLKLKWLLVEIFITQELEAERKAEGHHQLQSEFEASWATQDCLKEQTKCIRGQMQKRQFARWMS